MSATEAECQRAIVAAASILGYRVHHTRPARSQRGWSTPIQGHPGFPDLVIVGHGRCFIVELKRRGNKPTADQVHWINQLSMAGVDARLLIVPEGQQEFIDELAATAKHPARHGTVV